MSIPVPLDRLASAVAERDFCYVATVGEAAAHVLAVRVTIDGERLVAEVGRSTARNLADRPSVTLVFPPRCGDDGENADHSLIIGSGEILDDGADGLHRLAVTPTFAVLHRPAPQPTAGDQR